MTLSDSINIDPNELMAHYPLYTVASSDGDSTILDLNAIENAAEELKQTIRRQEEGARREIQRRSQENEEMRLNAITHHNQIEDNISPQGGNGGMLQEFGNVTENDYSDAISRSQAYGQSARREEAILRGDKIRIQENPSGVNSFYEEYNDFLRGFGSPRMFQIRALDCCQKALRKELNFCHGCKTRLV